MKVEALFSQGGVPAACILHFTYSTGTPNAVDLGVLATGTFNPFWLGVKADYPASTLLVGLKVTDLGVADGATITVPLGSAGTAEDTASPAQCCVLMDYSIARRYRGGHPRTYWPAVAYGSIATPSTWNADIVTDFIAAWEAMVATMGVVTSSGITIISQVSVSYVDADAYRVDNVTDFILAPSVSSLIRTQRRRVTASTY
jgi:hypothetical protein